jgi:hypothetical protein
VIVNFLPSPSRPGSSRFRRVRVGVAPLALGTLLACLGWPVAPTGSGAQTPPEAPPVTLSVSRDSGLTDGTRIDVTATARSDVKVHVQERNQQGSFSSMAICRAGMTYASVEDMRHTNGNCPAIGVTTSASSRAQLYPLPDGSGAKGSLVVGVGTLEWTAGSPAGGVNTFRLTCDPDNPCLLVAQVNVSINGGPFTDVFAAVELHFGTDDPTTACGERDPDQPVTGGADRMRDAWVALTLGDCRASGQSAPTAYTAPGEGGAIAGFTRGTLDMAYTATGYRPVKGLTPPEDSPVERPAVYTPVALNAAVVVAIGGQVTSSDPAWPVGMPQPYTEDVRLTRAEVATLLGKGQALFGSAYATDVLTRNPQMGNSVYAFTEKYVNPMALAGPDAATYYMTSFLDAQAPDQWVSSLTDAQGTPLPRGVVADITNTDPDPNFASALQPEFNRSQMAAIAQVSITQSVSNTGPGWALTDYETATALGLTPVAIENRSGEFVKPTPETLAAAVSGMVALPDGRLGPDPDASASGAYPLTMVEYAMAPATPLFDDNCNVRTHTQTLLTDWLRYVTGPGQAALPAGFVPLPDGLRQQAVASVDKVGTSPAVCGVTGPGSPPSVTPPPPTGPGAASTASATPDATSTARPTRSGEGIDGTSADLEALASQRGADAAALAVASEAAEEAEPRLPGLFGIVAVRRTLAPAALLLIVALTSVAALVTSGRPLLPRRRPPRATG